MIGLLFRHLKSFLHITWKNNQLKLKKRNNYTMIFETIMPKS